MSSFNKLVVLAVIAGVVAAGIFSVLSNHNNAVPVGASGSTFSTAKYAGVAIDLASNSGATSTSILNTDSSDRYVVAVELACRNTGSSFTAVTGAGLASLQLTVGTSSASSPASIVSIGAHSRVASAFVVGTATAPIIAVASSTTQVSTSTLGVLWKSGEYMTFWWNATNTPASGQTTVPCTEGVRYLGS